MHYLGTIFDVSSKADVYGQGKSYNVFAGKDGSRGLGLSSLDAENAVADYSSLNEKEMVVLNDWHSFFSYVSFFFLSFLDMFMSITHDFVFIKGNDTTSLAKLLMVPSQTLMMDFLPLTLRFLPMCNSLSRSSIIPPPPTLSVSLSPVK